MTQQIEFTLHYAGNGKILATVRPDETWPNMYRIHWPDGSISDLGNLSRVRDAAMAIVSRTVGHSTRLKWAQGGQPFEKTPDPSSDSPTTPK